MWLEQDVERTALLVNVHSTKDVIGHYGLLTQIELFTDTVLYRSYNKTTYYLTQVAKTGTPGPTPRAIHDTTLLPRH